MKVDGDNQSSSSDTNSSSSFTLTSSQHKVCCLHNTSEVICIKCLKKQVLDERININVVNGMILETKNILNGILSSSLFFEDKSVEIDIDDEYMEEIKILRTQAIVLKKNKEQKTLDDMKKELNELMKSNLEKRKSIESIIKVKDVNEVSADMSFKSQNDTNQKKNLVFYQQNMKTLEEKLLQELIYFINFRKNKHNNYYYICNNKLPLPRFLSKIVRIHDNSSLYNKRLYLMIEHLLNFFETGYRIYHKDDKEYEFLKMALNTAFSQEMEDTGKDKIIIVVIKKLTLILSFLQMIYIRRHNGQVTELLVDIKEVDYLAKLIRISLIDKQIQTFGESETFQLKDNNKPYDIISLYKNKLLSLL